MPTVTVGRIAKEPWTRAREGPTLIRASSGQVPRDGRQVPNPTGCGSLRTSPKASVKRRDWPADVWNYPQTRLKAEPSTPLRAIEPKCPVAEGKVLIEPAHCVAASAISSPRTKRLIVKPHSAPNRPPQALNFVGSMPWSRIISVFKNLRPRLVTLWPLLLPQVMHGDTPGIHFENRGAIDDHVLWVRVGKLGTKSGEGVAQNQAETGLPEIGHGWIPPHHSRRRSRIKLRVGRAGPSST